MSSGTQPDSPRVKPFACGGCPARWSSPSAAHCAACHHTFAGVALFDAHRAVDDEHGACIPPAEVQGRNGEQRMFFRDGMWRGPEMTEEAKAKLRGAGDDLIPA